MKMKISFFLLLSFLFVDFILAGDVVVFVSDQTTNGNGGTNLANFNSICQTDATNAGLPGTWNVMISYTGNTAKDQLPSGEAIYNTATPNRELLAADKDAFFPPGSNPTGEYIDADILHPDGRLPLHKVVPTVPDVIFPRTYVWTGSERVDSLPGTDDCNDWTSATTSNSGFRGELPSKENWFDGDASTACISQRHIYCFSLDADTAPTTEEPTTEAPSGTNVYVLLKDGFKETGWVDGYFIPFWDSDAANRLYTVTFIDVDASSDPSDGDTYEFQNPNGDGLKCNRVSCWFGASADVFEAEVISYDSGADVAVVTLSKGDKYLSYSNGKFSMQTGRKNAAIFKL